MARPPSFRAPKAAELVAGQIRNQIVRGELSEGDVLPPEAELQARLGVSRPTLREALRVLEVESLITIRHGAHGGAIVHTPSPDVAGRYAGMMLQMSGTTVADVYDARAHIEPPAARLLAMRADDAVFAQLHASLERQHAAVGDDADFARESIEFHELVVELAGNATLAACIGMLRHILLRHASATAEVPRTTDANTAAYDTHLHLVQLLEAGDADGAERYWRAHLAQGRDSMVSNINPTTIVDLLH